MKQLYVNLLRLTNTDNPNGLAISQEDASVNLYLLGRWTKKMKRYNMLA